MDKKISFWEALVGRNLSEEIGEITSDERKSAQAPFSIHGYQCYLTCYKGISIWGNTKGKKFVEYSYYTSAKRKEFSLNQALKGLRVLWRDCKGDVKTFNQLRCAAERVKNEYEMPYMDETLEEIGKTGNYTYHENRSNGYGDDFYASALFPMGNK